MGKLKTFLRWKVGTTKDHNPWVLWLRLVRRFRKEVIHSYFSDLSYHTLDSFHERAKKQKKEAVLRAISSFLPHVSLWHVKSKVMYEMAIFHLEFLLNIDFDWLSQMQYRKCIRKFRLHILVVNDVSYVRTRVVHFLVFEFTVRKQEKWLISCQETPGKPGKIYCC